MCFINASMVIGVQRYVPERSAELLCLPKQVFPAFGSCNGHVTAITSEAELNVIRENSYCCPIVVLRSYCCSVVTVQHFNTVQPLTLGNSKCYPPARVLSLES